ncbi:MAG: hypothetical protein QF719_09975 [Chloroflexota bacterium]|nr:hypothetical protein [Chloroflexota bacterium]MDP6758510.1 hypothetical protein [Chloroflexota bacterium]
MAVDEHSQAEGRDDAGGDGAKGEILEFSLIDGVLEQTGMIDLLEPADDPEADGTAATSASVLPLT